MERRVGVGVMLGGESGRELFSLFLSLRPAGLLT